MAGESLGVNQKNATQASVEQFRAEMEGARYMDGGQVDMESRGWTSAESNGVEHSGDPPKYSPQENRFMPGQIEESTPSQNEPNYQQMYGESENQKGAWRKTAEEAMAELHNLKGQLEVLRQVQNQTQPTAAAPPQRFVDKDGEELMYAQDVEDLVQQKIAPAIGYLQQQVQFYASSAYQAQKAALGLTPVVEQKLTQENPWLSSIQEGPQKLEAMRSLIAREQSQQPQTPPVNQAARRATFVESGRQNPSGTETPSQQELFEREMAEAMKKPWGAERKNAMEEVYHKYGVTHYNDFSGPGFLTR